LATQQDNGWMPSSRPESTAAWIVLKFGGTSVSSLARWRKIAAIAQQWRERGKRVVIVVSALSGITDKLKAIAEAEDAAARQHVREEIRARHQQMCEELGLIDHAPMRYWLERLDSLVVNTRADAPGLPWQAEVLALGELMSSTLGVAFLNAAGMPAHWLDAREHLHAQPIPNQNAWGRYLSASVPTTHDAAMSAALAARGDLFVTQGFMARNDAGETVILGRGGSDTSASYFGALLKAEKVEIWTDVAGMFSANPRQVPTARLLSKLDYEEAQEIATTGARSARATGDPRHQSSGTCRYRDRSDGRGRRAEHQGNQFAQWAHADRDGINRHVAAGRFPRRRLRAFQAAWFVGRSG
jgi:diaminopimelate decarboxylase/aspartate kinase